MPGRVVDLLPELPGSAAGQLLGRGGHFLLDDSLDRLFFFDVWDNFTSEYSEIRSPHGERIDLFG